MYIFFNEYFDGSFCSILYLQGICDFRGRGMWQKVRPIMIVATASARL